MRLTATIAPSSRSRISKTPSTTSRQPSSIWRSASASSGCAETKVSTTVRAGKRALQDEVVDDVDELGFIDGLTAGACPERLVRLPREAPGTGELDQLALEVTAMIQQACCLRRRGGVGHGISAGAGQPSASVRKHLSGGGSNGRRSRHLGSRASRRLIRPQRRYVGDEPSLEGLRLDVGRNLPGVHGQAIHVNDPGQRVLRGYIGTLELRREVTDPQEVADLP